MRNELVSVIIPYFKKKKFFFQTIKSVNKQIYKKSVGFPGLFVGLASLLHPLTMHNTLRKAIYLFGDSFERGAKPKLLTIITVDYSLKMYCR